MFSHNSSKSFVFLSIRDLSFHDVNTSTDSKSLVWVENDSLDVPVNATAWLSLSLNIPILSEKEVRAKKPDYMLVLPWHFRDGILQREKEFLKSGGRLIFPLPEIEII